MKKIIQFAHMKLLLYILIRDTFVFIIYVIKKFFGMSLPSLQMNSIRRSSDA